MLGRIVQLIGRRPQPQPKPAALPAGEESQAGIAVGPGDRLVIAFTEDRLADTALVSFTDGAHAVVSALAGRATFATDLDRLTIKHAGAPGRFEILVPRAAPSVEIRVGKCRIWLRERSKVVSRVRPDSEGHYLLPFPASQSLPLACS